MMESESKDILLFVPAVYDDYGWTPDEFRILARIHRRCLGKDGEVGRFFESIPNVAKATNMSQTVARRAFQVLEAAGAIKRVERPGATAVIYFQGPADWIPRSELPALRKRLTPIKSDRGRELNACPDWVKDTVSNGIHTDPNPARLKTVDFASGGSKSDRGVLSEPTGVALSNPAGVPLSKTIDKGIPSEGIPSEGIPSEGGVLQNLKNGKPKPKPKPADWIKRVIKANPDKDPQVVEVAVLATLIEKEGRQESIESLSDFDAAINLYDAASKEDQGYHSIDLALKSGRRRFGIEGI